MSRSDAHAVCSSSIAPLTITDRVAPIRPVWRLASRRSARRACATAIVVCMCCCGARVGTSTSREHTGSTMNWAFSYARVLTVVDTFSRFSPIIDPRFSYRAEDVVQSLERICRSNGYPKTIRVDQGSEFISRDMDLWAYAKGVTLDFS